MLTYPFKTKKVLLFDIEINCTAQSATKSQFISTKDTTNSNSLYVYYVSETNQKVFTDS